MNIYNSVRKNVLFKNVTEFYIFAFFGLTYSSDLKCIDSLTIFFIRDAVIKKDKTLTIH